MTNLEGLFPNSPSRQQSCPKCHGDFDTPRITEESDTHLGYWCPLCGYQYARWPKNEGRTSEPTEGG